MNSVDNDDIVIVYYLKKEWKTPIGEHRSYGKKYHYRKDCHALKNGKAEPRTTTEEDAQDRWLNLCGHCGDKKPRTQPKPNKYDDNLLNELSDSTNTE